MKWVSFTIIKYFDEFCKTKHLLDRWFFILFPQKPCNSHINTFYWETMHITKFILWKCSIQVIVQWVCIPKAVQPLSRSNLRTFHQPKKKLQPIGHQFPGPLPQALTTANPIPTSVDSSKEHIGGIIQSAVFWDWLLSLSSVFKLHLCCIPFYGWMIFHHVAISYFVYLFISV